MKADRPDERRNAEDQTRADANRKASGSEKLDLLSRPLKDFLQRPERSGFPDRHKHAGHMSDES